ncbi:MAG: OmpH family outer membrane protein [Bacteroidales bacterium]
MKKIFNIAVVLAFLCISMGAFAQTNAKLGYVDSQSILEAHPEKDNIQKELLKYSQSLKDQLQAMNIELQNKVQEYQNNEATLSDLVKQTKVKEIQDLQKRIQEFEMTANQEFNNKQNELLGPVLEKVQNAIKEVGKEKGYTYIFDLTSGSLVYYEKGDNLNDAVKAKLGIK